MGRLRRVQRPPTVLAPLRNVQQSLQKYHHLKRMKAKAIVPRTTSTMEMMTISTIMSRATNAEALSKIS